MSHNENLLLQRLLSQRNATALLQAMETSVTNLALALVRTDGSVFVSTANWSPSRADIQRWLASSDAGQGGHIDHIRLYPLAAGAHPVGAMIVSDEQSPPRSLALERALHASLNLILAEALEKRDVAAEALERYREINLMYRVSETIGALLDVEKITGLVLAESQRTIRAEAGVVFLVASDDAAWQVKAGFAPGEGAEVFSQMVPPTLGSAWQSDQPAIVTDYPSEIPYRALIWAPLKSQERVLGGIVLGRARGQPIFTASDEKLLMALARQTAIAVDNARLHQQVLEKERLEHELQLARDVQASLIPSRTPQIPGWQFAAYWNPAREVAGDFFDFIDHVGEESHSQHGIVIADVSDKGMHAALFMALTRSVLRAATTARQSPADSLKQSNRLLCADSTGGMFVTLFYAQLDTRQNEMTYVNAGHNPPLVYRAKTKTVELLERTGTMLGFDETMKFDQRAVQFHPGDLVILYTDGVTEAFNPADEQFGEERLLLVLQEHCDASPDEMLQSLRGTLAEFVGDRAQSDDITIVIAKCVGAAP